MTGRELQHVIEYALNILPYEQELISAAYIPEHIQNATGQRAAPPIPAQEQPQTVQQAMQHYMRKLGIRKSR